MKILIVPFHTKSHIIPMHILYKKYLAGMQGIFCYFLLPSSEHERFKQANIKVADFDNYPPMLSNNIINLERIPDFINAKRKCILEMKPDVVIEDSCFETAELCEEYHIPRISVQRTGFFRASDPWMRNPLHLHSIEKIQTKITGKKILSFKMYHPSETNLEDEKFYIAEYLLTPTYKNILQVQKRIIPGIPEIEQLPVWINPSSFFYSGPLLADDLADGKQMEDIRAFFKMHKGRKKVFLTLGLVEEGEIIYIFDYLIKKGYAIITTVPPPFGIKKSDIYYGPFLPLHYVSENVDLIIHQCGSSMYHYPIMHLKPMITIGTQCYDREEIAWKLEQLNIAAHVPSKYDDISYREKFERSMEKFEKNTLCDFSVLKRIRETVINTMHSFDMEKLLS